MRVHLERVWCRAQRELCASPTSERRCPGPLVCVLSTWDESDDDPQLVGVSATPVRPKGRDVTIESAARNPRTEQRTRSHISAGSTPGDSPMLS